MEFPRDPSAVLSGRRERPHPAWIRTSSFQVWNGGPKPPGLFPILSLSAGEVSELCRERGHLGNAKSWELPLEQSLGTFGNAGLGIFGEGHVVILWEKHPKGTTPGQGWRGDPRGSQAPAGIFPEKFWDWDLSTSSVPSTDNPEQSRYPGSSSGEVWLGQGCCN